MSVEAHRTKRRATECALRSGNINDVQSIDGSCLATVVNAQLLLPNTTLTIQSDFLCPITQLIPEDAVIFGRKFYERESAEQIIRDSLTKFLPRLKILSTRRTSYTRAEVGVPFEMSTRSSELLTNS